MRIPWNHLEDYIELHEACITSIVKLVQRDNMTKEMAETCLPKSFKDLNVRITQILRDNSEP